VIIDDAVIWAGAKMEDSYPNRRNRADVIVPIQFLRGAAACFVVTVHLIDRLIKRGAVPDGLPDWVHCFGEIGVATFFTISGFIMVHTTDGEFGNCMAAKRFLLRRLARILPIYYATTALSILFAVATLSWSTNKVYLPPSIENIILSFLFIPYVNAEGIAQPLYKLGWTLEYEMFFYLIFSLSMLFTQKIGMILAISFLTLAIAIGLIMPNVQPAYGDIVPVHYFTEPILLYFIIGMLIALLRRNGGLMVISQPEWVICGLGLCCMTIGVRYSAPDMSVASVIAASCAVAACTLLKAGMAGISRFDRISKAFGDASYSIYLTHSFLLGAIALIVAPLTRQSNGLLILIILATCALCSIMAWFVWKYAEAPMAKRLGPKRQSDC